MVNDSDDVKFMLVLICSMHLFSVGLGLVDFKDKWVIYLSYDLYRSALHAFKRRVAYANANYDRILFSLRLTFELLKFIYIGTVVCIYKNNVS